MKRLILKKNLVRTARHYPSLKLMAVPIAALKRTWRSPIYSFFKDNVSIRYENGRRYHFFQCGARICKNPLGGVRRFLDKKDRTSTANLQYHAVKCWGEDAVNSATERSQPQENPSGSIFASFARQGQQPAHVSHRSHTTVKARAHIVKWVTESNRPSEIIGDRELRELLTAGRPKLELPSSTTIRRDIKASFARCRDRIATLLRDHPGRLNFATDTWTSPNHRAICAWTVHLEHDGQPLSFLLDVVEVPESHTGETLAREFHNMLVRFGIENKVYSRYIYARMLANC
jgi:hypothetical protein